MKPSGRARGINLHALPERLRSAFRTMMDESDIRPLLERGCHREAFERIVDRLQNKIFHLALSMTHNDATAADLAQEALLRVWKALPTYNGSASLSTWIYTITRNVCLTELTRASRRRMVALDGPEGSPLLDTLPARDPPAAGAETDIDAMLARLPEKHRRVLRLFYLEQRSYEETAALLGLPIGTVKTHLFRARKQLARLAARTKTADRQTPTPCHEL